MHIHLTVIISVYTHMCHSLYHGHMEKQKMKMKWNLENEMEPGKWKWIEYRNGNATS